MRECLTNPEHGYYTRRKGAVPNITQPQQQNDIDQFGKQGDFITSPEISQVFGELIGIWFVSEWLAQGKPNSGVEIIELGPGRGTLMDDLLRTVGRFSNIHSSVECVWLVERSEELRAKQCQLLCGKNTQMRRVTRDVVGADGTKSFSWLEAQSEYDIHIRWVEDMNLIPPRQANQTPFIIAHEFFDALPIHAFEVVAPRVDETQRQSSTLLGTDGRPIQPSPRLPSASRLPAWRELLVSPVRQSRLSGIDGVTTTKYPAQSSNNSGDLDDKEDFTLTLARSSTPSSLVMPSRPRYAHLANKPGSRVEICPEAQNYMKQIARRIGVDNIAADTTQSSPKRRITVPPQPRGAALIIDYGPSSPDQVPINTLRAIKSHRLLPSPFITPGLADLSADVDFGALVDAALEASDCVECHGPIGQGQWLDALEGGERVKRLVEGVLRDGGAPQYSTSGSADEDTRAEPSRQEKEERAEQIRRGWQRLTGGSGVGGMGEVYRVLAVVPEGQGRRRPVGFGGDVVGWDESKVRGGTRG